MIPLGPILINNTTVWCFNIPYPSGNQCLALQSTSFIEQSIYMTRGLHHTRIGDTGNSVNIMINNSIIGATNNVAVNSWTLLQHRSEGISSTTTGIDNSIVI